jgi:hypothetical protein
MREALAVPELAPIPTPPPTSTPPNGVATHTGHMAVIEHVGGMDFDELGRAKEAWEETMVNMRALQSEVTPTTLPMLSIRAADDLEQS